MALVAVLFLSLPPVSGQTTSQSGCPEPDILALQGDVNQDLSVRVRWTRDTGPNSSVNVTVSLTDRFTETGFSVARNVSNLTSYDPTSDSNQTKTTNVSAPNGSWLTSLSISRPCWVVRPETTSTPSVTVAFRYVDVYLAGSSDCRAKGDLGAAPLRDDTVWVCLHIPSEARSRVSVLPLDPTDGSALKFAERPPSDVRREINQVLEDRYDDPTLYGGYRIDPATIGIPGVSSYGAESGPYVTAADAALDDLPKLQSFVTGYGSAVSDLDRHRPGDPQDEILATYQNASRSLSKLEQHTGSTLAGPRTQSRLIGPLSEHIQQLATDALDASLTQSGLVLGLAVVGGTAVTGLGGWSWLNRVQDEKRRRSPFTGEAVSTSRLLWMLGVAGIILVVVSFILGRALEILFFLGGSV